MSGIPDGDVFRAGVGLLILDRDSRALMFERSDIRGAWQLPQGGLNAGEDPETAAWRELLEETGLERTHVELEHVGDAWIGYELPVHMRSPKTGRGQVHRWFVFRLREGADLPTLPLGELAEFRNRRWTPLPELLDQVAGFRRAAYEALLRELGQLSPGKFGSLP